MTAGEPAGIGPDLALSLAARELPCRLAVIADPQVLADRARALSLSVEIDDWSAQPHQPGHLAVLPVSTRVPVETGRLDTRNAGFVLECLDLAVDGCRRGEFDAMVTGPVHKGVINDAGIEFTGHTEYLAERTGSPTPVMLLVVDRLRVALVTTHVALHAVSPLITSARLTAVLRVLDAGLRREFGLRAPHIAVCGLNPHAGESGHLGDEESRVIAPVVHSLRASGMNLSGPLPADTVFTPQQLSRFDAVLSMYHDQGLPVVKHLGFGRAVNVTLGLPVVRTSVDHGTALERAGTGDIDNGSLLAALALANDIVELRAGRT